MKTLYRNVSRSLDRVEFSALWPGFRRYPFALYDGVSAVLDGEVIPCPVQFRGNTTVSYQGRQLAIWNVALDPPDDPDRFASLLVHEMFHAFQVERGEGRFPDDLALAAAPLTAQCLALTAVEYSALAAGDLPRFKALRERRRGLTGGAIAEECKAETIEGMAQYMELSALGQISMEKRAAALAQCRQRLAQPRTLLDPRRRAYDSGALLLFAARDAGLVLHHRLGEETRPVYELLAPQVEAAPLPRFPADTAPWEALLKGRQEEREEILRAFLAAPHVKAEGEFTVCGYDPMNLWRQGELLYSSSYLCLQGPSGQVELPGRALLHMRPGSSDRADAYVCPV